VLGGRAAAGRLLREADDTPTSAPAAVVSYGLWKSRLHLDPGILGKTVLLDATAFTVAGVADASFFGERIRKSPDIWPPLSFQRPIMARESPLLQVMNSYWLNCMGRLKPAVTLKAAQAGCGCTASFVLSRASGYASNG